MSWTSAS
ncbi:hypothetical protein F383_11666 [Gossypium arboreum]|nr:hypothetical protein F383_11666 [Gossypium arboreum]